MYGSAPDPALAAADAQQRPYDEEPDMELPVVHWRAATISAAYSIAVWIMLVRLPELRTRLAVPDATPASYLFAACAAITFGAQVCTLLFQNFLFSPFAAKTRAEFGFTILSAVHIMFLTTFYWEDKPDTKNVWYVALGFLCLGIGAALAEVNSLAFFAPYGKTTLNYVAWGRTTVWLCVAGAYAVFDRLFPHNNSVGAVCHGFVAGWILVNGFLLWRLPVPAALEAVSKETQKKLGMNWSTANLWLTEPRIEIVLNVVASGCTVFIVAFSAIVYQRKWQKLFGAINVSPAVFLILACGAQFLGGCTGALIANRMPFARLSAFLFAGGGVALVIMREPTVALLGGAVAWCGFAMSSALVLAKLATTVSRDKLLAGFTAWLLLSMMCMVAAQVAAAPWANIIGEAGK